jgi:nitrite reductase/ring-hydroxylating ferredoxin subunit
MAEIDLCRLADIPDRSARGFTIGSGTDRQDILVVRWDDRVYGYVNRCPHAGSPLDWTPDRFMSADGRHLQCATHGALFQVEDGICLRGPCNGAGLTPFRVTLTGDRVVASAD